ncbi:MAG: hypothetical protein NUV80_05770, partial [Candidatus Berkelbacteria bacterium]|nr:hypothetical protein [Candidatus Berkelbacteria bacterium]
AQIKAANDTIVKQEDTLKKVFTLVETLAGSVSTAMSKQVKKDGVKVDTNSLTPEGMKAWREKHSL